MSRFSALLLGSILLLSACTKREAAILESTEWKPVPQNTWEDATGQFRMLKNHTILASLDGKEWNDVGSTTFRGSNTKLYLINYKQEVYESDDNGKTWKLSEGHAFVGKDGKQYMIDGDEIKTK